MTRTFAIGLAALSACTLGGVDAQPPYDAGPPPDAVVIVDAGVPDAANCDAGVNSDGDGLDDCAELTDGNPVTDPAVFNGFTATVGDRPEITGSCDALDDYAEMETRFASSTTSMDVYAGWEFETDADSYADPSYGFMPNWDSAPSERFSMRYTGRINFVADGMYCFRVDVGATGTGIVSGKNMCAQIYVGGGPAWLAETGYLAESADANEACVELTAGAHQLDIVFWYFNILETAKLEVRYCFGGDAACSPDTAVSAVKLQAGS